MGYREVIIVKGYILSIEDVYDLVKFLRGMFTGRNRLVYPCLSAPAKKIANKSRSWVDDNLFEINDILSRFNGITLYRSVCCSKEKRYILGNPVIRYKHLPVKCDACPEHTKCKECVGQTVNGFYDIEKIFKNFTEVEHVCEWCSSDKKQKGKCKFCKHHKLEKRGMKLIKPEPDVRLEEWIKNRVPKHYYTLDDCIYCS